MTYCQASCAKCGSTEIEYVTNVTITYRVLGVTAANELIVGEELSAEDFGDESSARCADCRTDFEGEHIVEGGWFATEYVD